MSSKFYDQSNKASSQPDIKISGNSSCATTRINIAGNQFYRSDGYNYTHAVIEHTGPNAPLVLVGNQTQSLPSGRSAFVSIAQDDNHRIAANQLATGWSVVLPTRRWLGEYEDANYHDNWHFRRPIFDTGPSQFPISIYDADNKKHKFIRNLNGVLEVVDNDFKSTIFSVSDNGMVRVGIVNFTDLNSAPDGTIVYCQNCASTNPCTTNGKGALAKRINGVWVCN
jgi:hypothetical protein